ncbi:MAG TPA: septal ring lytic transglycosylase RlpA family protein [Thermosulfurimonas dismutans]|uniref:Probable endolytic peptidoglycan transglycosylase RlpA n=1 Tax=Thermosulfurimonas dismutans TaxID=999894 RepID=A0A7C3GKD1_9BACT|nr:septal ring lytic transglycosylase RlpA family protein [Thermosulfurimonas dismutans]
MPFRLYRCLLVGGFLLILFSCGGPRNTVRIVHVPLKPAGKSYPAWSKPYTVNGHTYYPLPSAAGYVEEGLASWYGPGFHGRRTASGEIYNMYAFTAAHRILPLGTYVLVTNLENGRRVVVRINDRGPFVPGRIIDLSYAAARALGMLEKGVVRVRLVALAEGHRSGNQIVFQRIPRWRKGEFYLQVGAFRHYALAVRLRERLARRFPSVLIEPYTSPRGTFYRVKIFLAYDLDLARKKAQKLKQEFPTAFLVAR